MLDPQDQYFTIKEVQKQQHEGSQSTKFHQNRVQIRQFNSKVYDFIIRVMSTE